MGRRGAGLRSHSRLDGDEPLGLVQADPLARAAERDSVRVALVAAMQLLPPRQRAMLVLRICWNLKAEYS
jgi:DNA-directed RNA polymerase specialized sigma24 family protein